MRAVVAGIVLLLAHPSGLAAQVIPLTTKLTGLTGIWTRDTTRGTGGICGVPVASRIEMDVAPAEVAIRTNVFTGTLKLDGTETVLSDGRTARASLDAGWLKVTMRRNRTQGFANVMQEVYIHTGTDLTVWRVLNVVLPDGGDGKIDCGNRHAIVYRRE